jgi:hypothetical protein
MYGGFRQDEDISDDSRKKFNSRQTGVNDIVIKQG